MSNSLVGSVYSTIIDEVISSSRVDFEESGVDEAALEILRKGWQHKLTQLDVAAFPWDPKPEPTYAPPPAQAPVQAQAPPPPATNMSYGTESAASKHTPVNHSQARFSPQIALPSGAPSAGPAGNQMYNMDPNKPGSYPNGFKMESGEPSVKVEPGSQAMPPYPGYNGADSKGNVAAHRAAQQLQAQYGVRAAGSINAIQSQSQTPGQSDAQASQQAYRQQMAAATAQQQEQQRHAQMDGPDDDDDEPTAAEGVLLRQGPNGDYSEMGRVEIDRMLHDQIASKAKSMEGGGLMVPLAEATRHKSRRSRPYAKGKERAVPQLDGEDDDDDEVADEDAINSDLDDSDEGENEDDVDDDGGLGHIMLCMYDKVQRVKNKWKCTLKDGVLTVNGAEYVFHKATGEYEW